MKFLFTLITVVVFSIVTAQDIEKIKIPKGVTYNYCDSKTIENAKKLITEELIDSTKFELSDSMLIVGPQLWNRFKNIKVLNEIENGDVILHVDDLDLSGKMTQDINDTKKVWNEFRKEVNGSFNIRKATEQELKYYWSVISFDIEEPLLIVETKEHNYILNIIKNDLKLMWLDEAPVNKSYYNPIENQVYESEGGFKVYRNGKEIDTISKGVKETKLEKVVFLSSNKDLEENTSTKDIHALIDKTSKIFDELFKDSQKQGKIMVQFELKKDENQIQFAVRNDIDLEIMKKFEERINAEKFPNSKKETIKLQLIYKVNSLNDTE